VFTLKKKFTFEAAHYLPNHVGKCRRVHGHSWVGWAEVEGESLHVEGPESGMLVDYNCIAAAVRPLVEDYLDHYLLNDTLEMESPTSEAIAEWIFHRIRGAGLPVTAVTIEETCTSVCTYRA
jgi:6-pyruvoyltetrahydropterin/6-carboxytetrahydropterin synthase